MSVAVITDSAGLIGSETTRFVAGQGMDVVGIDNDMRRRFFGDEASTRWQHDTLKQTLNHAYQYFDVDIRDHYWRPPCDD